MRGLGVRTHPPEHRIIGADYLRCLSIPRFTVVRCLHHLVGLRASGEMRTGALISIVLWRLCSKCGVGVVDAVIHAFLSSPSFRLGHRLMRSGGGGRVHALFPIDGSPPVCYALEKTITDWQLSVRSHVEICAHDRLSRVGCLPLDSFLEYIPDCGCLGRDVLVSTEWISTE